MKHPSVSIPCSSHWLRGVIRIVLPEQVGSPVDDVEHGEHERKEDARNDVDSFRSGRELGQPLFPPVFMFLLMDLTGTLFYNEFSSLK